MKIIMLKKTSICVILLVVLVMSLSFFAIAETQTTQKTYKVVLINNFMGNTWRPIMERSVQLLIDEPPLKGRISELRIINTENSASAQNAALNSVIMSKPDIILIDAASPTALNQTVKAAADAGIVVVSFDVNVESPYAWKIGDDFEYMGLAQTQWLMNAIGGKGTIFWDQGQPGAKSVDDWLNGCKSVLDKYPDVKTCKYYGQFSPGEEQNAVATLVSSHPEVNGLLTHGYGKYGLDALDRAGHEPVPTTGFSYSENLISSTKYDVPMLYYSSPAWVSASALILAVDVLDGKRSGPPTFVRLSVPWFTNNDFSFPNPEGDPIYRIEDYVNDLQPGIMLPLSPPWAELDIKKVMEAPTIE